MDQVVLNHFRTRLLEKLGWKEDGEDPKVQYNEESLTLSPGFVEIASLTFKIRGGGTTEGAEDIIVWAGSTHLFSHRRNPCVVCPRMKSGQYSITAAARFVQSEYNAHVRQSLVEIEQNAEEDAKEENIRTIKAIGEAVGWKPTASYRGETLERDNIAISYDAEGSGTGRNRRYKLCFRVKDVDSASLEAWVKVLTGLNKI